MSDQVRHKTFISYHGDDHEEVEKFIKTFDQDRDVFIARALGSDRTMDELIESENDEYVMRRIREDQIKDSTVTLLFVGKNTWNRKFVDWEIAASLHQGPKAGLPNGVLAILSPELSEAILPTGSSTIGNRICEFLSLPQEPGTARQVDRAGLRIQGR